MSPMHSVAKTRGEGQLESPRCAVSLGRKRELIAYGQWLMAGPRNLGDRRSSLVKRISKERYLVVREASLVEERKAVQRDGQGR